jgi:predicted TIM-barrel fold metal-dependent hydrolase
VSEVATCWAASELAAEFWEHGRAESCPVYDMHGHMGPLASIFFPRCEPADMVRSMDGSGVRMLCFSHHSALMSPDVGNSLAIEAVRQFPDRFRAYLAVNPHYPELSAADLAAYDALSDVYVGLKLLADYHKVAIDDEPYRAALEFANERGILVLSHTWGGSSFDGPDNVRRVAERYPNVRFLAGHSFHPHWDAAVAVADDCPNVWLELTAVLGFRSALEMMCDGAGSERMVYGTDLPWFDEHQCIGSVLCAEITDEDRHNILHRNAEKLLTGKLGA